MKPIKLNEIQCEEDWNRVFLKKVLDAWCQGDLITLANQFQLAHDPKQFSWLGDFPHPIANVIFDMKGNYAFTDCDRDAVVLLHQAVAAAGVPDVYTQHMINSLFFKFGTDQERAAVIANQAPYVLEKMPVSETSKVARSGCIDAFWTALAQGKATLSLSEKALLCNHILGFYSPSRKLELHCITQNKAEAVELKNALKSEYQSQVVVEEAPRHDGVVIERF